MARFSAIGTQGPQGVQGPAGQSFTVKGSYANLAAFQADAGSRAGALGDGWIILTDGSLYVYASTGWFDAGDIIGPQGQKGDTGLTGSPGPKGDQGIQGIQGATGPMPVLTELTTLLPAIDNTYDLGSAVKRWHHLYVGPDSITMVDTSSGHDVIFSTSNGALLINGADVIRIGNMGFTATGISSAVSSQDITIGATGDTGYLSTARGIKFPDATVQTTAASALYSGAFVDTTTQVSGGNTVANVVTLNTTSRSNGISVVSNSRVTFAHAGDYFLNFIGQFRFSGGASSYDATVWYTKNGVTSSATATSITLTSAQNNESLATLTDIISVAAGDYIQFYWYSSVAPSAGPNGIYLYSNAAGTNPTRPVAPSVKLNILNVG